MLLLPLSIGLSGDPCTIGLTLPFGRLRVQKIRALTFPNSSFKRSLTCVAVMSVECMCKLHKCKKIRNVIYNARSNMRHSPNSPNTAPATKNDRPKSQRNLLKTDETSFPMRGRSDHDPTMKPSVRNPPRNRCYFSRPPRAFCIEKYNISRIIPNFTEYCAFHEK